MKAKVDRRDNSFGLMQYFCNHPKLGMHSISAFERQVVQSSMKRLLDNYEPDAIRALINRYMLTFGVQELLSPAKVFCSKKVQERLIEARQKSITDVDRWIDDGFVRDETMDLPWEVQYDSEIKRAIITNPDIAQDIIDEYS